MKILIYSTTTCPYCRMLKDYLNSKNVPFEEKLVDQDDTAREEMMQVSGGFLGVPFTVVEKDSGERQTIIGFDKNSFEELLSGIQK